jgi:hypothetical protein
MAKIKLFDSEEEKKIAIAALSTVFLFAHIIRNGLDTVSGYTIDLSTNIAKMTLKKFFPSEKSEDLL